MADQTRSADLLYPTSAKAPAGPVTDPAGWVELPGGGWRKLPDHLARAPRPEKTSAAQRLYEERKS
jgi:hypothetical protein